MTDKNTKAGNPAIVNLFLVLVSAIVTVFVFVGIWLFLSTGNADQQKIARSPTTEELLNNPEIVGFAPANDKNATNFLVTVENDEQVQADWHSRRDAQSILDRADEITRRISRRRPDQPMASFDNLNDEEKNRVWWEIADIATQSNSDRLRFTLTVVQARRIGKHYNTSVLQVFKLFREGANARWRTQDPPQVVADTESQSSNSI